MKRLIVVVLTIVSPMAVWAGELDPKLIAMQQAVWLSDDLRVARIAVRCLFRIDAWEHAISDVVVGDVGVMLVKVYPKTGADMAVAMALYANNEGDAEFARFGKAACDDAREHLPSVDRKLGAVGVPPGK